MISAGSYDVAPAHRVAARLCPWAHQRWAIEQQYQELKNELGLEQFKGRSLPGWNAPLSGGPAVKCSDSARAHVWLSANSGRTRTAGGAGENDGDLVRNEPKRDGLALVNWRSNRRLGFKGKGWTSRSKSRAIQRRRGVTWRPRAGAAHSEAHRGTICRPGRTRRAGRGRHHEPPQTLQRLRARHADGRRPYVFTNARTGDRYTVNGALHIFRRAVDRAGIRTGDVTLHTLRHTAISRMIAQGFDDFTVMEISGHSSTRMLGRYTHPTESRKADALNSFALVTKRSQSPDAPRDELAELKELLGKVGGRREDRTPGLRVANAALSQLS